MIPGLAAFEQFLRLLCLAMEGQTPEQRAKMWDWFIVDVERWRKFFKLDA